MSLRPTSLFWLTQSTILLSGALYAWSFVYRDFLNYFGSADDIPMECLQGGTVLSACFAGAGVFLVLFIASLIIYRERRSGGNASISQGFLTWMLGGSSLLAWGFTGLRAVNMVQWMNTDGCVIEGSHIPVEDPCLHGATLFALAFFWALLLVFRTRATRTM
ncbi:MAG: hypothetical protein HGB03_03465 [Candidatus Yonathbacteria bacterium]|nr:hypothetical protein [Candidatus Yonathbacteria bacterium]NTW47703.1 hypothetical protein [Candidatus Yonathbacteria bacterium]